MKKGWPSYQVRLQRRAYERAINRRARKFNWHYSKETAQPAAHSNKRSNQSQIAGAWQTLKAKFQSFSTNSRRVAFQKKI